MGFIHTNFLLIFLSTIFAELVSVSMINNHSESNSKDIFENSSDSYLKNYSADLHEGSGSVQPIIAVRQAVNSRESNATSDCVINSQFRQVLFVIDVGKYFPYNALENVRDFVMSTVNILDIRRKNVHVGVLTVGGRYTSGGGKTEEVLSFENGYSRKNIFESFKKIKRGNGTFNLEATLSDVNKYKSKTTSTNAITILVIALPDPSRAGQVRKRLHNLNLYTVAVGVSSEAESYISLSRDHYIHIPSYWALSNSRLLIESLIQKYGCNVCIPNPCDQPEDCIVNSKCGHSLSCSPSYVCDPCRSLTCLNGGYCQIDELGEALCICADMFVGQNCELSCSLCKNGGKCMLRQDSPVCECYGSFVGSDCGNIRCGKEICSTGVGWCAEDINGQKHCPPLSCDSSYCRNGGTCLIIDDAMTCSCTPRYKGSFCEKDRCDSLICRNGGTCSVDSNNHLVCICPFSYSGSDCSVKSCYGNICYNGGTCIPNEKARTLCSCPPGFLPPTCKVDPCYSSPCHNNGSCIAKEGSPPYRCECPFGYSGLNCLFHPCRPNPCYNGGRCRPVLESDLQTYNYQCTCISNFTGKKCEQIKAEQLAACNPNPCLHPCECVPSCMHADGYVCVGRDGRLGKTCSIAPPELTCRSDKIILEIDRRLMAELQGNSGAAGYFYLARDEHQYMHSRCRSIKTVANDNFAAYKLILEAPFTDCGTMTSINSKGDIVVSNKVWFNVERRDSFDMPVPVLLVHCNYSSHYLVSTSVNPIVDSNNVDIKSEGRFSVPVLFEICKLVSTCVEKCPSNLVVQPGAVYTVGQFINVIIKLPKLKNGGAMVLADLYVSCDDSAISDPIATIVRNGCPMPSLSARIYTSNTSTCVVFQVYRFRRCSAIFLHARMTRCRLPLQFCGQNSLRATRCPRTSRQKRAVSNEDVFGPMFILPPSKQIDNQQRLNATYKHPDQHIPKRAGNFLILVIFGSCLILTLFGLIVSAIVYSSYCKNSCSKY